MFKKLQKAASNPKLKKKLAVVCCALMMCTMMVPLASAADGTTGETYMSAEQAAQQMLGLVTAEVNFGTILSVIGVGIGAALALMLGWWGLRKLVKMVIGAFKKGNVSL